MGPNQLPPVTDDDILAGQKIVTIINRAGAKIPINVTALPWRQALALSDGDLRPGQQVIGVLDHCVDRKIITDQVLDSIDPMTLIALSSIAQKLTMGKPDEAKKKQDPPMLPTSIAFTARKET